MPTQENSTLIVVNPKARDGKLSRLWPQREKQIRNALGSSEIKIEFTSAEDHGSGIVRNALREGIQKVVVVGGDGTLSEVIQGFFDHGKPVSPDATLMVMPGGRGDDFFKTIANQRFFTGQSAWNFGLEILRSGSPHSIDIGSIQWIGETPLAPRYFINIGSFGFPGLVVEKVQAYEGFLAKSFLGKNALAYSLQSLSAMRQYQPLQVQIKIDSKIFFEGDLLSGFILNGRFNAGGICWSPEASIQDGLFHLLLMRPQRWFERIRSHGKKIEVLIQNFDSKAYPFFEIDGENLENPDTRGAVFEVIPQAIRLQLPR